MYTIIHRHEILIDEEFDVWDYEHIIVSPELPTKKDIKNYSKKFDPVAYYQYYVSWETDDDLAEQNLDEFIEYQ